MTARNRLLIAAACLAATFRAAGWIAPAVPYGIWDGAAMVIFGLGLLFMFMGLFAFGLGGSKREGAVLLKTAGVCWSVAVVFGGLSLISSSIQLTSGDAPGRVMGSDMGNPITAKAPKPTTHQPATSSSIQAGAFDPFCVKCDGAMSAPLTDDEIGQAGDAAQIAVLGIRENGMLRAVDLSTEPPWRSYQVTEVPLPTMPNKAQWPVTKPQEWFYLPVSPVPDAPSWAAMLIGFGAVGMMLRRTRACR